MRRPYGWVLAGGGWGLTTFAGTVDLRDPCPGIEMPGSTDEVPPGLAHVRADMSENALNLGEVL